MVNDINWFDNMVCYLRSIYLFITNEVLYEFYQGQINLKNSCHITIDDGDKSFYDVIFPVLKKHSVPASIYVSPKICMEESNYWFQEVNGCNHLEMKRIIADMSHISLDSIIKYNTESILKTMRINKIHEVIKRYQKITHTPKKPFQNMTVSNLKEVNLSGLVTIGAHTLNHPILKNEDDVTSKYEINESINGLSSLLNNEIKYFSYPNGIPDLDFSEREKSYLRRMGVQLAFTTESKNISSNEDTMCVPRFAVTNTESISFLKTKLFLGSLWEPIKQLKPASEYREREELSKIIS